MEVGEGGRREEYIAFLVFERFLAPCFIELLMFYW